MSSTVRESKGDKLFLLCNYIYLTIALIIVLYPPLYIVSASISDPKYVSSGEMWLIPKGITFDGYAGCLRMPTFGLATRTRLFIQ